MGRVARLLKNTLEKFIITTVEARLGLNHDAKLYAPAGILAVPLKDDRLLLVKTDGAGKFCAAGVLNELQDDLGDIAEGDLWLYSRDGDGKPQAYAKLNHDGTLEITAPKAVTVDNKDSVGITIKGNATVTGEKAINVKGKDVKVEGDVVVTGGSFTCGGTVSPTGNGALCGIPACLFNGAPQTGDTAQGT